MSGFIIFLLGIGSLPILVRLYLTSKKGPEIKTEITGYGTRKPKHGWKNKTRFEAVEKYIPVGFELYNDDIPVSGVTHHLTNVREFVDSDNRSVYLMQNPKNKYDSNAIKVMGKYDFNGRTRSRLIGYLPSEEAESVCGVMAYNEVIAVLAGVYHPLKSGVSPGIRLDLYEANGRCS